MTPAEARDLVAQALESGEYEQGKGFLCVDGKYCCLGVATEVYMKHYSQFISKTTSIIKAGKVTCYECWNEQSTDYLLSPVREWLGFETSRGNFNESSLARLNDAGTPFKEIAKLFRNPPEGLLE